MTALGQGVFHSWGDFRIGLPRDQLVLFEFFQAGTQHFQGDAVDATEHFSETQRPFILKKQDDED